ncbi:amidohydrolase family protein [Corynebacterium auriscanis]|uniref:amidohydrolase family protein n=1 Tax=Corynebacterium auriscanis TaxID=99807 RepID=UPI003CFA18BB
MSHMHAIDTHAHVYPAEYLDKLEAMGVDPATTAIARGMNADSSEKDLTRRLEWMDKAGVETQILAVTPQSPSSDSPQASLDAAQWVNDEYARIVEEYPGRFHAYGALPLPHVDQSVREAIRVLEELKFVGISVPTITQGKIFLDDPRFDPVWAALNERGAVVNVHPTGGGACSPMLASQKLEWVNGAPVEDATATLQLLKADVPRRFPNITFHIAHLGGDLPFLSQRIEDNYTDWDAFSASPNAQLRQMFFDAANFHEPSLRLAAETFGAEQIMAGSDHPYFQDEHYVRAFDYVRSAKLPQHEIEAILRGNAQKLLGI